MHVPLIENDNLEEIKTIIVRAAGGNVLGVYLKPRCFLIARTEYLTLRVKGKKFI